MKHKYLLLTVFLLAIGAVACKKEGSKYPIVGKWQQTKLRLYGLGPSGSILYDTTYLHPFTNLDYAQFNSNDTAIIGTDHYYYPNQAGEPKTPQLIPASTVKWGYTMSGSKYILNNEIFFTTPGGSITRDTVYTLTSNTLMLHSVFYSSTGGYKLMSDSYYSK